MPSTEYLVPNTRPNNRVLPSTRPNNRVLPNTRALPSTRKPSITEYSGNEYSDYSAYTLVKYSGSTRSSNLLLVASLNFSNNLMKGYPCILDVRDGWQLRCPSTQYLFVSKNTCDLKLHQEATRPN